MRALITGAGGQDGTLLTSLLAGHGFEVLGISRSAAGTPLPAGASRRRLDVCDEQAVRRLVAEFQPDHAYLLAACHHSSEHRGDTALDHQMVATNFWATEVLLSAVAAERPACRVLVAGSSQMYTGTRGEITAVDEQTPMRPSTFYGWTKSWSRELLAFYRDHRGIFGGTAILFNHESPLRSPAFVTRKIAMAAARASIGQETSLHLLDVTRRTDWSAASDVVGGLMMVLTAAEPSDYVFASGQARSVQDVLESAFGCVGLAWRDFVMSEQPDEARPHGALVGEATRARNRLGWSPRVSFERMIEEMVAADVAKLRSARAS